MAGASAGSAIGGWILGLLGLRALVQDLVGTLPRALQYYQQGIQEAWGGRRRTGVAAARRNGIMAV